MTVYLNECPICGGKAELIHAYNDRIAHMVRDPHAAIDAYYCECPACGKSTDEFLTEEEAAEIWNNSGTGDLKETDERIIRSVVLTPFRVWLDTFLRLFLLLLGPVILLFLVYSTKYTNRNELDMAWWLWATYGIILAMWLGFGIPTYVKFAKARNRLIRHLPKKEHPALIVAVIFGYVAVLLVHALLYTYLLFPIANASRPTLSAPSVASSDISSVQ